MTAPPLALNITQAEPVKEESTKKYVIKAGNAVPQEDVESTTTEAEIRVIGTEGDELIYEADIADDQRRAVHEDVQEVATEGETEESRDDYDLESVSTES